VATHVPGRGGRLPLRRPGSRPRLAGAPRAGDAGPAATLAARPGSPLRDPGSLQPYLRAGFSETAALSWHRLLSEQKLVGRDRATLPTALAWRQAGVGLPALYRWSAKGPTPKFGPRYPITWQAAFLHAGCPNLQTALPWLDLVRQRRRFTLQDAVLLYRTTPIDWVRAWA
jgi:hypothetical protein